MQTYSLVISNSQYALEAPKRGEGEHDMAWKGLEKLTAKIRGFIPQYTVMQRKIHCPNYDCGAAITTRIRLRAGHRARHVAVETCSLLPKLPAAAGGRVVWAPDPPYLDQQLCESDYQPHYTIGVSCPETCLKLINGEARSRIRVGREVA